MALPHDQAAHDRHAAELEQNIGALMRAGLDPAEAIFSSFKRANAGLSEHYAKQAKGDEQ